MRISYMRIYDYVYFMLRYEQFAHGAFRCYKQSSAVLELLFLSKISALQVLEQASQPCSSWQRAAECDLQKSFNSKLVLNPCGMTKVLFHYFFIFHLHLKWRICCDIKQNQSCSKEVFDISCIRSKLPIFSNLFFFTHQKTLGN